MSYRTPASRSLINLVTAMVFSLAVGLAGCGGGGGGGDPAASPAPVSGSLTGQTPAEEAPAPAPATSGTTYHVRTDGGSATQCTGKTNAAYPGTGTARDCAWISPMVALPAYGTARIAGGDTLLIHAGQYRIGHGAPAGAEKCNTTYPYDCYMPSVPSGPDAAHPTRILGEGYDTGCANAPQLWGTQRVSRVLSLEKSNNVKMACLEVTDHSACVDIHALASQKCNRDTYPLGDWAPTGLSAFDSSNVELTDLNIHGLANAGMNAARIKDWTLSRVRIAANGWVGWGGDIGSTTSSNSGTIKFSHVTIEWNGCAETYGPGMTPTPTACWSQTAGGYGDGLGTAATGGNWVIEDSAFLHNTSDGLDLLYASGAATVTLNRVWAEGNAGNQIKVGGSASVTNSVVVGNCGFFDSKPFTYNVDPCRAYGDALAFSMKSASNVSSLVNSTVVGQGNVVVLGVGPVGAKLKVQNNILIGKPYYFDPSIQMADIYYDLGTITVTDAGNLKQTLRSVKCTTSTGVICGSAGLVNDSFTAFNPQLLSTSLARDSAQSGALVPAADYYGTVRPTGAGIDRGAVEFK